VFEDNFQRWLGARNVRDGGDAPRGQFAVVSVGGLVGVWYEHDVRGWLGFAQITADGKSEAVRDAPDRERIIARGPDLGPEANADGALLGQLLEQSARGLPCPIQPDDAEQSIREAASAGLLIGVVGFSDELDQHGSLPPAFSISWSSDSTGSNQRSDAWQ
jgi:hypothetical protein